MQKNYGIYSNKYFTGVPKNILYLGVLMLQNFVIPYWLLACRRQVISDFNF